MKRSACSSIFRPILIAALLCLFAVASYAFQTVPNPVVSGPIAVTAPPGDPSHAYPFFSADVDLASRGYVEEEFFFSGTATAYTIGDPLSTAVPTPGSAKPYKTRMIVRRPIVPENFNGVVILEWQNVTAGYDFDALWIQSREHLLRRGYAWIGVSAQPMAINAPGTGLKAWSPRYGTLVVPADALAFDIFSQAAQAVRHPDGIDPMGGLPVMIIMAAGASQAADRLATYYNSVHPLAGVVDAFLAVAGGDRLRTDLDVKAFKLLTETDVAGNPMKASQAYIRQEQSDRFRRWEIAGSAHLDYHFKWEGINALQVRDGMPSTPPPCTNPPFSRIPAYFVLNAAYDHMAEWVKDDVAPPVADDILVETFGAQISVLARDSFGNAQGGIRLAQHEVAIATNTGINFPALTFCRTFGTYVPFDEATLRALYRNHGSYVSQVARVTESNLLRGFIVSEDATATMEAAAQSDIGRKN